MKHQHRRIGFKLMAFVAVVGVGILSAATTVDACRRAPRANMELHVTVDSNYVVDGELISYVGTLDFGRGRVYGIAFFSTGAPTPLHGDWVEYSDRYEIYDTTKFFKIKDNVLKRFDPPDPIFELTEWGVGNFERNVFVGFGHVVDDNADGIRLFRGVDVGDRAIYKGEFAGEYLFVGTFKMFRH